MSAEPMSPERRAEIDRLMDVGGPSMPWAAAEAIIDLRAEVDRLRSDPVRQAAERWHEAGIEVKVARKAFELGDIDLETLGAATIARSDATRALLAALSGEHPEQQT